MMVVDNLPDDPVDDSYDKTAVMTGDQVTLNNELQKAKEQEACLIIIRGTRQGHRFFLTQPSMMIGRDPEAQISFADSGISRKHALITKKDGQVYLTDLGSANGTLINGKKIIAHEPTLLSKEDMIKVANIILKYLPAGELEILFYGNLGSAAHTDALTRIYNKGYLLEVLDAEFKRARALRIDFCVIFIDLDFFKKVNDQFGHDAGDFVLKEFTALIRSSFLRPKDIFARYGGEEFVILLSRTDSAAALNLAERMRAAVEAHAFIYEEKRIPVTISIGISELQSGIESPQTLLKHSDQALYQAKGSGRNKVVFFT